MERIPEATIVPELELEDESDLVCEPIPVSVSVGILIEYKGMKLSTTLIPNVEVSVLSLNSIVIIRNVKRLVPSLLHRLHCGPSSLKLQKTPSSLQLRLGQSSPCLRYGLMVHPFDSTGLLSLKLHQTPSSFQLRLSQSSPWLRHRLLVLRLLLLLPPLWLHQALIPHASSDSLVPSALPWLLALKFHQTPLSLQPQSVITLFAPWTSGLPATLSPSTPLAPPGSYPSISARLPHPFSSTLVSHHPGCATDSPFLPWACILMALFGVTPWLLPQSSPP
ncbi:hypothetical protein DPX16_4718 [Anabarilius grahami]|uniref:Uncharacterized protein n=1 Tax=Anabarilius grahami TaxID=495550 RepID=A0A3N0YGU2_ANAGA|nr:hypothetical protein DPX16_4718 [Anabarilius grahami]